MLPITIPCPTASPAWNRFRRASLLTAVLAASVAAAIDIDAASANPAAGPGAITRTTAGALAAGTVPDGTCGASVIAIGGGGASSTAGGGATGGVGGPGARISATFQVVPGIAYSGNVGGGGTVPNGGAGDGALGTGGAGGTIVNVHRGGGGGGRTRVDLGGAPAIIAGAGGGGGATHGNSPLGAAGGGGFGAIAPGGVAVGSDGQAGADGANTAAGGLGGAATAGGNGGVNSGSAAASGAAGGGPATGTGGNGGIDPSADSAGGGGGGYTGGGGGASTVNSTVSGAGGGGGSSWLVANSPLPGAAAPTAVAGVAGPATPAGSSPGSAGSIAIDWLPCQYQLAVTKTVDAPRVNAGGARTWTVAVTNSGPDAMTRGDTVTLADTLPVGPNGANTPAFRVTSFTVTGGTNTLLDRGAVTCTGVGVGGAMPASTVCSRPYAAPTAPGAPAGGTRGLDPGETVTITYEQVVSNVAPCTSIQNTATVVDRATQTGTTDIQGVLATRTAAATLGIDCYDLSITKTAAPVGGVLPGSNITWTITVTNTGPADMEGPADTAANPLVVTDAFPTAVVGAPVLTSATGPAGACTRVGNTITCAAGLPSGGVETLTFTQLVNAGVAAGTVISNTASVTDPKVGGAGNSSTTSQTVKAVPTANPDTATIRQGTAATVDVLANDAAGAPGTPLDATSVRLINPADGSLVATLSIPGEGTYSVDPVSGAITFTPDPAFFGVATPVRYRVADAAGTTAETTLTITVIKNPVASPDTGSTPQNVNVDVDVLANDTPGGLPLDATTVFIRDPADGVFKRTVTIAGQGTYTVNATTGLVTFDPLPAFTGSATPVTYGVSDTAGASTQSTITISVVALAPTAANDAASTPFGTPTTVTVLTNDAPGAPGAPLDPTSVRLRDPADGLFKPSITTVAGTYTADPVTGTITFTPAAGFSGTAPSITYQVADSNGTTATASLTMSVTADPSPLPDTLSTPQGTAITISPLANDVSGGSPFDPTTVQLRDPADGTFKTSVTVAGVGTYSVNPTTGQVTFTPDPTFTGTAPPITYRVTDGDGLVRTSTITATVVPIVPIARDDAASTPSGTPVTVDVPANDSSGASSTPLDPTSVQLQDPADGTFKTSVTIAGQGTFTVDPATGRVTFVPVPGYSGTSSISYRINDSNNTGATAKLSVTVTPPPGAQADSAATEQNQPVTIDPLVNDVVGGAPFDPAALLIQDPADGVFKTTVTIAGQGTWTVDPATGKITFTPLPTFTGTATPVTYQVTDLDGLVASASINASVAPVVPTASDDYVRLPFGTVATIPLLANDVAGSGRVPLDPASLQLKDPADGTFKDIVTIPGVGTFVVNPANGEVTFTATAGFSGATPTLDYRVNDRNGTSTSATLGITVSPAPTASDDAATTQQGKPVTGNPLRNDRIGGAAFDPSSVRLINPAGNPVLSLVVPGQGSWTVDRSRGAVTFKPLASFSGAATPVTYQVTDLDGLTATAKIIVNVTAVVPRATDDSLAPTGRRSVVIDPLANDTGNRSAPLDPKSVLLIDPKTGALSRSVVVKGQGRYSVDPVTGRITFVPVPSFFGLASVPYRIADINGTTTRANVNVTILESRARLTVTKRVSQPVARVGDQFQWTQVVTNTSKVTARNVTICDVAPPGFSYTKTPAGVVRRNGHLCITVKSLEPGKSVRLVTTGRFSLAARRVLNGHVKASASNATTVTDRAGIRLIVPPPRVPPSVTG